MKAKDEDAHTLAERLLHRAGSEADLLEHAWQAGRSGQMTAAVVKALLSIADDSTCSVVVRCRAILVLEPWLEEVRYDHRKRAQNSSKLVQQSLYRLYSDSDVPDEVRRRGLEAAVCGYEEWHAPAILTAWSSQDRSWRMSALACMGKTPGFDRQILEALDSDDEAFLLNAVVAAGNAECQPAWTRLRALLKAHGTSRELLLVTIPAIAMIGQWRAGKVLFPLLASQDPEIVNCIEQALVSVGLDSNSYEE